MTFVLIKAPPQRPLADLPQIAVHGTSGRIRLHQLRDRDDVGDSECSKCQYSQNQNNAYGAGEMARIHEDEWDQSQEENDGPGGLAEDSYCKERDRHCEDGNAKYRSGCFTSPEPRGDKRGGGHPNAELGAVFE